MDQSNDIPQKREFDATKGELHSSLENSTMKYRSDIEIDSLENSRPTSPESYLNDTDERLDISIPYNESQQIACLKKVVENLGKYIIYC